MRLAAAAVLLFVSLAALAQERPVAGNNELGVFVSGGHGTTGATSGTAILSFGLRYGWVLTNSHGPGPLRGRFEYAVDAVPATLVFQRNNTFGTGINPVVLKWNFERHGRWAPYMEIDGGLLFTTDQVPPGTSNVNFTPGAAVGVQFFGHHWNPMIGVRYMHISNAGLSEPNPGINTVQVMIGLGRFFH
jgi:lipid A 3-O-deacylase